MIQTYSWLLPGLGFAGVLRALRHVLEKEGWGGLYDGLPTDTASTITSKYTPRFSLTRTLVELEYYFTAFFIFTSTPSCEHS